jgi:hypothetical protein
VRDVAGRDRVRRQKYFLAKIENRKIAKMQKGKKPKARISGNFASEKRLAKAKDDRNPFKPPRSVESCEFTLASFFFIVPVIQ